MKLSELVSLIEQEAKLSARIDRELAKWKGGTLRTALTTFGAGSLRKSAKALGVSASYLSNVQQGKMGTRGSMRRLMVKVHRTFGIGGAK